MKWAKNGLKTGSKVALLFVAERELPAAESSEKRINVAFVLPSGEQISWAQARALASSPSNETEIHRNV
jgi:hypothetical protein